MSKASVKCKRVNLFVNQKLVLIKKLKTGMSVVRVCEEDSVKNQTISDNKKNKVS